MRQATRRASSAAIFAATLTAVLVVSYSSGLGAQRGRGTAPQNPACSLLTSAELRTLTGFQGYTNPSPGDAPGEGVGAGASCQYSAPVFPAIDARGNPLPPQKAPMVSIVLIDGKDLTRTTPVANGCRKEPASGVGDEAFFVVCPASRLMRTSPLYVKAGARDLIVQMDIQTPDTEADLRPKVIAIAKAAAAKMR